VTVPRTGGRLEGAKEDEYQRGTYSSLLKIDAKKAGPREEGAG